MPAEPKIVLVRGAPPVRVADQHRFEVSGGGSHCTHWQEGDGSCCRCKEPNWCPDDGETPQALERFEQRRRTCPAAAVPSVHHTEETPDARNT